MMKERIESLRKEIDLTPEKFTFLSSFSREGNLLKYVKKSANDSKENQFFTYYINHILEIEEKIRSDSDEFNNLDYQKKYLKNDILSLLYNFPINPKVIHNSGHTSESSIILVSKKLDNNINDYKFKKIVRNGKTNIPTNLKLKEPKRPIIIFSYDFNGYYHFIGYFTFDYENDDYIFLKKYDYPDKDNFKTFQWSFRKTAKYFEKSSFRKTILEEKTDQNYLKFQKKSNINKINDNKNSKNIDNKIKAKGNDMVKDNLSDDKITLRDIEIKKNNQNKNEQTFEIGIETLRELLEENSKRKSSNRDFNVGDITDKISEFKNELLHERAEQKLKNRIDKEFSELKKILIYKDFEDEEEYKGSKNRKKIKNVEEEKELEEKINALRKEFLQSSDNNKNVSDFNEEDLKNNIERTIERELKNLRSDFKEAKETNNNSNQEFSAEFKNTLKNDLEHTIEREFKFLREDFNSKLEEGAKNNNNSDDVDLKQTIKVEIENTLDTKMDELREMLLKSIPSTAPANSPEAIKEVQESFEVKTDDENADFEEQSSIESVKPEAPKEVPSSKQFVEHDQDLGIKESELTLFRVINKYLKEKLFETYGKCEVTNIKNIDFLYVTYIKPWLNSNKSERVDIDNAILLNKYHSLLFAKGLITFNSNGEINYSSKFNGDKYTNISNITINPKRDRYLEWHRKNVFQK